MYHCPSHLKYVAALPWETISPNLLCLNKCFFFVCRDISRTVQWVRGWSSWVRIISFTWSMFSSVRALSGLALPWRLSTVAVSLKSLSNLLMLLILYPLCGILSSTVTRMDILIHTCIFFIRILLSSLKNTFTNEVTLWRMGWCWRILHAKQVIA